MKEQIENPKVFISYAWGSKEYQDKVLSFAAQLSNDGIEVVLDKWSLEEGNDTFAFMEKCITDSTITNVLMLLDPVYAKKADAHKGGVGAETQIISAKVYKEVEQNKFLPIVFERDSKGAVCKPTYLEGRLHFDLTEAEKYDDEYQRLVRRLYGIETFPKPSVGKKPFWVNQQVVVPLKDINIYNDLKNNYSETVKQSMLRQFLQKITRDICFFCNQETSAEDDVIKVYTSTNPIRLSFFELIKKSIYVGNSHQLIADFFEDSFNEIQVFYTDNSEIAKVLIHELFLSVIAFYLKNKNYVAIGHIFWKTYLHRYNYSNNDYYSDSFCMFYSAGYHQKLDDAVCKKNNKHYGSGTAQLWLELIPTELYSKYDFLLADSICFNCSIFGKQHIGQWKWFPITYLFDDYYNSVLKSITAKMSTKEHMKKMLPMFGFDSVEDFIRSFAAVPSNEYSLYRFESAFNRAFVLRDFIKPDQISVQ